MSYLDRLRQMRYTSPSGQEFVLLFDELERTGGKKAPVTEFPGQDQGAVQDLGEETGSFPVTCYVAGANYDQEADRFWDALSETGAAVLQHPRWGNRSVVPSTRSQKERFIADARVAVFTVVFLIASAEQFEYPGAVVETAALTQNRAEAAFISISTTVPEEVTDPGLINQMRAWISQTVSTVVGAFATVAGLTDAVRGEINQTASDIINAADSLASAPAQLMTAMIRLYRLPTRVETSVRAKVTGYTALYDTLRATATGTSRGGNPTFGALLSGNLFAVAAAKVEATTTGEIPTREQAAEIVDALSTTAEKIRKDTESLEATDQIVASWEMIRDAEAAIASAAEGVVSRALNLPGEQSLVLDRDVNPVQLAYELYGDLNSLDEFIRYNALGGDDLIMLPRGRTVRWYE